ncbi:DUF3993 domain-containing protein [Bacillus sp. DTU_2020_1000418_1_SI_GHA_SEK_038]|uniref:DUF3993 domain-containing protein n=1 Tax=Bacillus sp. DTU_2020_1000418_1_SI_GHA_SEK_038 TaxID=3077585 RepID=UPI0028E787EF|nr:DUF3993 domain-containing protein [Bacillus sp. DTU_2020_1000418_1_SI_GHA_SEK_038]WNS76994.1 DUF3993 domain-containing protein [Bacillus sp. DTU_2020_1000418_1_SI_GHA_SEK_038]
MNKLFIKIFPIIVAITFTFPALTKAEETLSNRDDVFEFVQAAYHAQLSLGEKPRAMDEIDKILSPYFTEEAKGIFLEENLFSENGLFITYGTDFPFYYIPYFTYTDDTKLVSQENEMYLFEFFPEMDEGPVSYESHYEGLLLAYTVDGWRIAEFLYNNIPEQVMHPEKKQKDSHSTSIDREAYYQKIVQSSFQVGLCMNPLEFLIKYGGYCSTFISGK